MKRIGKGHYQADNGFEVVKDKSSYSQLFWVITHEDYDTLQKYLDCGYDQCFYTLSEANSYISEINL